MAALCVSVAAANVPAAAANVTLETVIKKIQEQQKKTATRGYGNRAEAFELIESARERRARADALAAGEIDDRRERERRAAERRDEAVAD